MRILVLFVAVSLALPLSAQPNPVTNGGFEAITPGGVPVGWSILGSVKVVNEAHAGERAVLLERNPQTQGEVGLNREWRPMSGEQGTMLSQLKGGIRFWYKADAGAAHALTMFVIPMSADPFENTGEMRAAFHVPESHIGDGQWHEGVLKYDFTGNKNVRWVHISPRITGQTAKLLLDDICWVEKVGPVPMFGKTQIVEVPGKEGDECLLKAQICNLGDEPIELGMASVELPRGLSAEGGPLRNIQSLAPDGVANVTWRIMGRRADKGVMTLHLRAADRDASGQVAYAPELEVVGLCAQQFILEPNRPARVSLCLRNTGHAMVRELKAQLQPGVPLTVDRSTRRQELEFLRPQTGVDLTWEFSATQQTPSARLSAWADAANVAGGRAATEVIVGPTLPQIPLQTAGPAVSVADTLAVIGNDHIRLLFPRAEFGFGIGVLQRKVGGQWQTVGKLPRVTRLAVFKSRYDYDERFVYASHAEAVPSPEAVADAATTKTLKLTARITDALGVNWHVAEVIRLRPGEDALHMTVEAVPDKDSDLLVLEGPMLYVGEGAPEGTRRLDAIFPGLEWLAPGEESSSSLDIAPQHPDRIRYVPHPHFVTIPLMTTRLQPPSGEASVVSLQWDHLRSYHSDHNRPSAVFASPDRFEGRAATLMGLFAPSMPEFVKPNARLAYSPLRVVANSAVTLEATLLALPCGPHETSLKAVLAWFSANGVPEPNPLPHGKTFQDEIAFSMAAYLTSLWDDEERKWHPYRGGPGLWDIPSLNPGFLYDLRMCLDACPDSDTRRQVQQRYDQVMALNGNQPPHSDDLGFQFAGPANALEGQAEQVASLIRAQGEDGSWRFRTRIETAGVFKGMDYSELGPDNAAEVGTCAHNAWTVLRFARMTGDKAAREAGLKALAFMDRFEVPRAAQVWEVPVHTPDILASADACEAYLEGYQITGDRKLLEKAVYWAWTGLPFVYTWDVPGFEFLKYGSIPVFGATWYEGSWFGRPVQWNGLRFAYALFQLARYDNSLDWFKVAKGITVSCMYQQSTDETDKALWPDSQYSVNKEKSGWIFAPAQILKNVYTMMGLEAAPVTATARAGFDDFRISAAGKVLDALYEGGSLMFRIRYTPPQSGFGLVCNTSKPTSVRVNGQEAKEVLLPATSEPPCWRYIPDFAVLELRLKGSETHAVELVGVKFQQGAYQSPPADKIAFDFAASAEGWRAAHDLEPFAIKDNLLITRATGPDPYMVRPNLSVPAASVKQVRIRMALTPGTSPTAQLFWTTAEQPGWDEPKSMHFATVVDGELHDFVVPVSEHALWTGTITGIRIDPTGGTPVGDIKVDFVRGE